jgi:hypothetical protein
MRTRFRAKHRLLLTCALIAVGGAVQAGETPKPSPEKTFIRTTAADCAIRGGEYRAEPGSKPDDLVDCILPRQTRSIGTITPVPSEVLASVYDYLYSPSVERPGYALYSYVLLPGENSRGERLLREVFGTTSFAGVEGVRTDQLNIIYVPTRAIEASRLASIVKDGNAPSAAEFSHGSYDYVLARSLLTRICGAVTAKTQSVCGGDLSLGPYLFTFLQPVSGLEKVPAPFLLLDLSNVHERAFGEFVAAYKEQVKQPQFSDRNRIDTFRLRILSVVLTSADWLKPLVGDTASAATMVE